MFYMFEVNNTEVITVKLYSVIKQHQSHSNLIMFPVLSTHQTPQLNIKNDKQVINITSIINVNQYHGVQLQAMHKSNTFTSNVSTKNG